jgi:hypothetical protein
LVAAELKEAFSLVEVLKEDMLEALEEEESVEV